MNTIESLGYLKGLIDGLEVKNESEAKIYKAIIEVIENIVDDIDDIYILALSSTNYPEEIKTRYNLKHEFVFRDKASRLELLKEQDEVGTYTNKILELRVIQELIKEAKK